MVREVLVMFLFLGVVSSRSSSDYFSRKGSRALNPKDNINQWNIVQVGSQPGQQGGEQSGSPGFVWVQVPIANLAVFGNTQISQSQNPNTGDSGKVETSETLGGFQQPENKPVVSNPVTVSATAGENLDQLCLKPTGQFPSKFCNKFINCWNGVAVEQECPDGLLFSPKGYCDYQEHVNCDAKPTEGSVTFLPVISSTPPPTNVPDQSSAVTTLSPPISAPTVATLPPVDPTLKKLCLNPRGQFPGTSCKKYVNCWDDVIVEQECPEGLLFSSKGYCDYPENVECGKGNGGTNKVAIQEVLECPLKFGTFRDKKECSIYYTCVSYKIAATYVCPEGFKFSENLGVCDYQERVDCTEKPTQKRDFLVSNSLQENGECSVKYGTYRDVNNCSRYYTCSSFKVVAQHDCPPGFNFNDDIGICDYSHNVDCNKNPKMYEITSSSILQIPTEYRARVNSCIPGSVFPLNSQCSVACLCRQGLAEIIQCPTGFAYDFRTDKCVLTHLAKC